VAEAAYLLISGDKYKDFPPQYRYFLCFFSSFGALAHIFSIFNKKRAHPSLNLLAYSNSYRPIQASGLSLAVSLRNWK
jgi:hypothetical protein